MNMQAANYQEVVTITRSIVEKARRDNDQIGYFAALYLRVTETIETCIQNGDFDDGPRMERMITTFANRYFAALVAYQEALPVSGPWKVAFNFTRKRSGVLLQHLLLAMNAHINLDLGIAAAEVNGTNLDTFHNDFDKINAVLASLMGKVIDEFGQIWPIIKIVDRLMRGSETFFLDFDMQVARNHAWSVAQRLVHLHPDEQVAAVQTLDAEVTLLGVIISKPVFPIDLLIELFRVANHKNVAQMIDILLEP